MCSNPKHLEFIQNNIARMNKCSFQMKGWTLTIVSALLAIFAASINVNSCGNKLFIFIAIFPTFLFWIIDSFYLSKERKFVGLYNDIVKPRENTEKIIDFEMPIENYRGWKYSFWNALLSFTEITFYLSIIIGLILFGVLY